MNAHVSEIRNVIKDFVNYEKDQNSSNIFKDDDVVVERFSEASQNKNIKRRLKRHDIVPTAFVNYLQEGTEFGQCGIKWPPRRITVTELAELLKGSYKLALIEKCPWLHQAFT
jgi:hypothetical protein